MKTIKLIMFTALLAVTFSTQAQVSVNVNLGTPPVWAVAAPPKVEYYYLPDIDTYYDVPAQRYIYLRNGSWVRTSALPARYRGYDLYRGRTVYLSDYRGHRPYEFYKSHKVKYKGNGKWNHNGHKKSNKHDNENHGKSKGHKKEKD